MDSNKEVLSQNEGSHRSQNLLRVHQRQSNGEKESKDETSDEESFSEKHFQHLQPFTEASIEHHDEKLHSANGTIRRDSYAADNSTNDYTMPGCNFVGTPVQQFTELHFQLKPAIQEPEVEEEGDTSGCQSPKNDQSADTFANNDSIFDNSIESRKDLYVSDSLSSSSSHEPRVRFQFPEYLSQSRTRQSVLHIHETVVNIQPLESVVPEEPLTHPVAHFYVSSPVTMRETAPPEEIILTPIKLPQITLQQGPKLTLPFTHVSRSVSTKPDETESDDLQDSSESTQAPPPYSECVQNMPRTSFTRYKKKQQDNLPSYISAQANIYKMRALMRSQTAGYSHLPGSSMSTIDTEVAALQGKRATDRRVELDERMQGFMASDHQLLAFVSCLFCWPIGLVAIYYSNMSQMLKEEGNYAQAQVYSRQAFFISALALYMGSLTYVAMIIYQKML